MGVLAVVSLIFIVIYLLRQYGSRLIRIISLSWRARTVMAATQGPPAIPILGSVHLFKWSVKDFTFQVEEWGHRYMMDNVKKSQGLMHMWVGPVPLMVAGTHESIAPLLESNTLITKPSQYNILSEWLGTGLLIKTNEEWHSRRKLLTPAFHFNILRGYIPIFGEQAEIMVDLLEEFADTDEIVDVYGHIKRCALDIISEAAMGIRLSTQSGDNADYLDAVQRISAIVWDHQRFPWLWVKPIWYLTGVGGEFERKVKLAHDFTKSVIAARRELLDDEGFFGDDVDEDELKGKKLAFLDLLLHLQKTNTLSDEDIRSEVDTFMFEGHDTTSSSMGFTMWLLGQNPKEQQRVHDELDTIFGDSSRHPTEEDLRQLVHLERCIKETLRLLPPVPIVARQLSHETKIGDHILPEGMTVLISPIAAHHDPRCWERPEEFYPDHFLPEKQAARPAFSFVPFSAGPRNCIGQRFGMLEEKVILSWIFRRFRVESVDIWPENRPLPEIILKPSNGFRVKLYKRAEY